MGGYHQEDDNYGGHGKIRRPKKRWLDNIRDVMKEYKMTEDMAQNRRSVWQIMTKAGPLLHVGGLRMRSG